MMSPGSNVPFKAIQELGARTDVRMKQAAEKLEDFLRKINQLRISRFAQFYTEDRYFRIKGSDGKVKQGTLTSNELQKEWPRETIMVDQVDPHTGEQYQEAVQRMEKFVPEFDIKITILSEKPTDRNYYTSLAMQLYQMQLLTPEDLLHTLEEGKLPPMDDVLEHVYAQNAVLAIVNQIQQIPQELQQMAMQTIQGVLQEFLAGLNEAVMVQAKGQIQGQNQGQGGAMMGQMMPRQGQQMGGM